MNDRVAVPLTDFQAWPKTPRHKPLHCHITEKIDGTNAQIVIRRPDPTNDGPLPHEVCVVADDAGGPYILYVSAASRTRFITPESDNFGFARWVRDHAAELVALGVGRHYGEWYGAGIQRRYGLDHKRFALFHERESTTRPACCEVVPTLYHGFYSPEVVTEIHERLMHTGSQAVPGWMRPEGVVIRLVNNAHMQKITDAVAGSKSV